MFCLAYFTFCHQIVAEKLSIQNLVLKYLSVKLTYFPNILQKIIHDKAINIKMFLVLGVVESSRHNWSGLDKQSDIQNLNEERILALQLCGWIKKGTDVDVGPFLNSLVQEGEWERAAAVALFNSDIRRAIQILNEGASSEKGIGFIF